jgi:ABC-type multidrug transport system permease subunit
MRTVFDIALNDLRIFFSNRGNLIWLVGVPVGMTIILGVAIPSDNGPSLVPVDIIDHDQGQASALFIQSLRQANPNLLLCPMDNTADDPCDMNEAESLDSAQSLIRLEESETLALIEIPDDFTARVSDLEPVTIRFVAVEDLTAPQFIQQAVDSALTRTNGALTASLIGSRLAAQVEADAIDDSALAQSLRDRAAAMWAKDLIAVKYQLTQSSSSGSVGGFGQSIPGIGSMFVLFAVLGGMALMIEDKRQWTMQRLASMPVTRSQLLGGKILGRFTLGMLQYLIIFAIGVIVGQSFGRDPLALILIMLAFALCVTALSFALGSFVKDETQAAGLTNLLGISLAALGGAWWSLEVVPELMRTVGHISPVAWAMDGYTSLIFENGDLGTVYPSILILLGAAAVFFVFGVRRFRYDL